MHMIFVETDLSVLYLVIMHCFLKQTMTNPSHKREVKDFMAIFYLECNHNPHFTISRAIPNRI